MSTDATTTSLTPHDRCPSLPSLQSCTVAVIGLGYVGLPLAVAFATPAPCVRTGEGLRRRVIGFDINLLRLEELRQGLDRTRETSAQELGAAELLELCDDPELLAEADVFVVTVPTPIDSAKRPDLTPLQKSSATVGRALKLRTERRRANGQTPTTPLVIYESTVYPGATEEVCVPILERESGLTFNDARPWMGFGCGRGLAVGAPTFSTQFQGTADGGTRLLQWSEIWTLGAIDRGGDRHHKHIRLGQKLRVVTQLQQLGSAQLLSGGLAGAVETLAQLLEPQEIDVETNHPPPQAFPGPHTRGRCRERHSQGQAHVAKSDHRHRAGLQRGQGWAPVVRCQGSGRSVSRHQVRRVRKESRRGERHTTPSSCEGKENEAAGAMSVEGSGACMTCTVGAATLAGSRRAAERSALRVPSAEGHGPMDKGRNESEAQNTGPSLG